MAWRVQAEAPGEYELRVRAGDETFPKTLLVSDEAVRRSPMGVTI